jgi:hypothetical protein
MKLSLKILAITLFSFLLSNGIYFILEKGRQKYFYHTYDQFNELLSRDTKYDIVMLGSSRTHLHNNPKIIDSITGMDSYNAGIEGGSLMEMNVVLNGYLEKHPKPTVLLVEVSMLSFNTDKSLVSNPTLYLNHLDNNGVYETLNTYWKYSGFFKYLPLFRLSQYDDINKAYALKAFNGEKESLFGETYKGYAENTVDHMSDTVTANGIGCEWVKYTSLSKKLLENIFTTCKKANIKVIAVYAPEYRQLNFRCPEGKLVIDTISELCKKNEIPFLNYLDNEICNDNNLFANIGHLNRQGADKYSAILGEDINRLMRK